MPHENEPIRKIGYARVSTADQNPDMQIEALKRYGVTEDLIFMDKASGGSMKRPNFIRAMRLAQHAGSEFVVWKLDRLGRTLSGVLKVMELLQKRDIAFISLTERIDTSGPMGKAMIRLMAIFAELERDLIRERTLAGIRRARERGETGGRPRGMTDDRVARAKELLADGARGTEIWRELKLMSGPGLSRACYYAWQKKWDVENDKPEV